jgi:hypothetical protein
MRGQAGIANVMGFAAKHPIDSGTDFMPAIGTSERSIEQFYQPNQE